jgi:hypothetical protein
MKAVRPWPQNTECPEQGFAEFKARLNRASYHNASDNAYELKDARLCIQEAAQIAIASDWPYWVMDRMFREIAPLVAWDSFMQTYINELAGGRK